VERTFPLHSPKIEKIEVTAIGDVNRAKLYYLRGKVGKRARVRAKRGVALPVMEVAPPPTEADMPPEDAEPEGLDEGVVEEPEAEEPQAEEPQAEEAQAEEAPAEAEPAEAEAEPVAEQ